MDPKRRVLVLIAVLAVGAAAFVGAVACTSGTTPDCSDAQCGAPQLDDSGEDAADSAAPPETGPDVGPDTTSPDAPEAGEAGEGGKGGEAGDAPAGDAPADGSREGGEAGPKDAAADG